MPDVVCYCMNNMGPGTALTLILGMTMLSTVISFKQ